MAKKKKKGPPQKPGRPSRHRESGAWIAGLLFLAASGIYLNTLGHGFVFDDNTLILQNLTVTEHRWLGILFGGEYRPIRTLSYAVNHALGGLDPFGYHLFNLLLHGGVVVALFGLIRNLTGSLRAAAMGALLFAVHPAQTAAVAYISGRKDLLAVFFLVLGLTLLTGGRKRLAAGIVCLVLAVLSKEVAVIFPVLLLLVAVGRELQQNENSERVPSAVVAALSRYRTALAVSAGAAVGLGLWSIWLREASRAEGLWGGSWATNLGTSLKLFVHYLEVAVTGQPLVADYSGRAFAVATGLAEPDVLLSVVVFVGFVALALRLLWWAPWASVGLFWFLAALLPVLHIIPFHELAADHFLYLPLAGLALTFGWTADWLAARWKLPAWALVGIIAAAGAVRTWQRNPVWADSTTLWQATLVDAPDSYRANQGVALALSRQGRYAEAIPVARRATELNPEGTAWANLGNYQLQLGQAYRKAGRYQEAGPVLDEALENIDRAVDLEPDNPFFLNSRGLVLRELAHLSDHGRRPEQALAQRRAAAETFKQALSTPERRVEVQRIWMNMAGIFQDISDFETARFYLDHYLRAFPDEPEGNFNMGEAFVKTGDYDKAVPFLEQGLAADPTSIEGWDYLGKAYLGAGRPRQAADAYRRALPYAKAPAEVHLNLGTIYAGLGELEAAKRHLEQALAADPNGPLVSRILQKLNEVRTADPSATG